MTEKVTIGAIQLGTCRRVKHRVVHQRASYWPHCLPEGIIQSVHRKDQL